MLVFRVILRAMWATRRLSNKSKSGGWIIQHVTATTPFGMQIHHADYWEAWQVPAGSRITSYAVTGDINDDTFTATGGTRVRGEARFYEGLKLPSLFQPDNPATPAAGFLPATPVNPNLSTDNATEPVDRTWTAP